MFPGTSSGTYAVTIILNGQKISLSCYLLNQLNMTYYNLVIYLKTI